METAPHQSRILKFGLFEVDLEAGELRKSGMRQKLAGQPFEVLRLLLEHPQEIVSREELQRRIWPKDTFVDYDLALKKAVNRIREVLGDSAESPRFIETIPRRGYRFIWPLSRDGHPGNVELPVPGNRHSRRGLRTGFVLGLVVATLLGLRFLPSESWRRVFAKSAVPQIRSIAVLPLQNLSVDPAQEYFSDGMTDALITELAQIDSVKVISRTSTIQYKGTKKTLPEIARELTVDAVIEGTVQRSGDRVRITTQLIQGASDKHLWAASYEGDLRDALALESEVARAITGAIKIHLSPAQNSRLAGAPPIDREAYDLYLKGRYELNKRERVALARARDFFDRATVRDPDHAEGYAGLASCYLMLGEYEVLPPAEAYPKARDAAARALQIDETLAEAHLVLAGVKRNYDWDFPQAEREFRRGIELSPNSSTAHQWYAEMLSEDLGRHEDAVAEMENAQRLDSLSPIVNTVYGDVLLSAGRSDAARLQLEHTLAMDPDFAYAHAILGNIYLHENLIGKAAEEYRRAIVVSPHSPWYISMLAFCYDRLGNRAEAKKLLQALLAQSQNGYVPLFDIAAAYEAVGQKREALAYLEKAFDERDVKLRWLERKPNFENLRSNRRFQDLLRRISAAQRKDPPVSSTLSGPGTWCTGL